METTKDFSEMTPQGTPQGKAPEQAELTYSQAQGRRPPRRMALGRAREGGTVILYALVIAFLVKTFLLRGFYIPSGSMEQTLQVNDRVFINVAGSTLAIPSAATSLSSRTLGLDSSTQKTSSPLKDGLSFMGILPDTSSNYLVKRVSVLPVTWSKRRQRQIKVNGVEITEPYLYPATSPRRCPSK